MKISEKTIPILLILFSAIALPALGELTDADLDKIRLIIREEVKAEIKEDRPCLFGLKALMKSHATFNK